MNVEQYYQLEYDDRVAVDDWLREQGLIEKLVVQYEVDLAHPDKVAVEHHRFDEAGRVVGAGGNVRAIYSVTQPPPLV